MRTGGRTIGLALALWLAAPAAFAQGGGQEGGTAATALSQVMSARGAVQADCGFDILRESPLGDLTCKSGTRTAVEAWDEALTKAGLPAAERERVGGQLGLTPAPGDDPTGLWRADPRDVALLIANLRLKAGG